MKKFQKILCLIVFMFCLIAFTGCSDVILKGKSAYEIAVDNGFVGSEVEWLESLKGSDGQDGTDGVNGTAGLDGEDGKDITAKDLFNLAVEYGLYENNADGYSKFLSDYLTDNVKTKTVQEVASECLNQVVSIYCENSEGDIQAGAGVIYEINNTKNYAYIITNYHVVCCEETYGFAEASSIVVYLYGQETLVLLEDETIDYGSCAIRPNYIGGSADYDLAVLKVTGEGFKKIKNSSASQVEFADTDAIQLGSTAIAIGNPASGGMAVTSGVVSVDSEYIEVNIANIERHLRSMRIDTPINQGSSGGGLFDINAKLIGITNAGSLYYENFAYALCGSNVKSLVKNIIDFYEAKVATLEQNGENSDGVTVGVHKFLIGITITAENSRNVYNSSEKTNILQEDVRVVDVAIGGISESIGFKIGDIIRNISVTRGEDVTNYAITRFFRLGDSMLDFRVGDSVVYTVDRLNLESGEYEEITLDSFTVTFKGFVEYKGAN